MMAYLFSRHSVYWESYRLRSANDKTDGECHEKCNHESNNIVAWRCWAERRMYMISEPKPTFCGAPAQARSIHAWAVRHAYIKRSKPQLYGKVERSHRSDQQEFY